MKYSISLIQNSLGRKCHEYWAGPYTDINDVHRYFESFYQENIQYPVVMGFRQFKIEEIKNT